MDPSNLRLILKNLTGKTTAGDRIIPLYDLDNEHQQIYKVLENTVKYHEGKSMLLVGPRGVAKTTLVNNCLLELGEKYDGQFLVIRISGLYERDDKTAIREIARQLDLITGDDEEGAGDTGFEKLSSDATMNTIMNLLDRSRLNEEGQGEGDNGRDQIPLIFVIDEIDRYTSSSKQTLLYNLFDLAAGRGEGGPGGSSSAHSTASSAHSATSSAHHAAPYTASSTITVIGITTKATVREQLEKRVKSRFSQRVIHINKWKTLTDFCGAVLTMLRIDEGSEKWIKEYNDRVEKMVYETGSPLRKIIVENFYTLKDLNAVKNRVVPFVASGFFDEKWLKGDLRDYSDRNFELIGSLSELELKLLICTARMKAKNSIDRVNFNVAYEEYVKMSMNESKTLNSQLEIMGVSVKQYGGYMVSRELMLTCWERLSTIGIMGEPMKQINGVNAGSYTGGEFNKMYVCDIELNEIMKWKGEGWVERWCRITG
ncbi:DEKNAAC104427 [Brettanomyces naardenensis]|uniref:Origin recognition complex subunit 4 n=1 Tax=Brettanomyces naardenensis TaxID=13370 RepID=A0A448YQS3_BRENA|nr:DEKNAAC104427 [Brettanomyces naardenensis]